MVLQRKRSITQSASGSVNVSWEMARVSTAVRVKNPRDKRLCFMGLWGFRLACNVQGWCKVGANGEGWQVRNAQKVRIGRKDVLASEPMLRIF